MSGGISPPYLPLFPAHYFFIRLITSRSETQPLTHEGLEGGKLSNAVRSSWTDWKEMQRGKQGDNQGDRFPGALCWRWQYQAPLAHAQLCAASAFQLHWKSDFPVCQTLNPKGIYWNPGGKTLDEPHPTNNIGHFYNHSPGVGSVPAEAYIHQDCGALFTSQPTHLCILVLFLVLLMCGELCQFKKLVWLKTKRAGEGKRGEKRESENHKFIKGKTCFHLETSLYLTAFLVWIPLEQPNPGMMLKPLIW